MKSPDVESFDAAAARILLSLLVVADECMKASLAREAGLRGQYEADMGRKSKSIKRLLTNSRRLMDECDRLRNKWLDTEERRAAAVERQAVLAEMMGETEEDRKRVAEELESTISRLSRENTRLRGAIEKLRELAINSGAWFVRGNDESETYGDKVNKVVSSVK